MPGDSVSTGRPQALKTVVGIALVGVVALLLAFNESIAAGLKGAISGATIAIDVVPIVATLTRLLLPITAIFERTDRRAIIVIHQVTVVTLLHAVLRDIVAAPCSAAGIQA